MSVNTNNSNLLPMTLQGVSVQSPAPPTAIVPGVSLTKGRTPSTISAPYQVIGLVPLFSCCQNRAYVYWVNTIGGNVVTFHVVINGTDYGTFSTTGTDSSGTNLANFSALLPSGMTAVISFINVASLNTWTVTIYADSTIWNGATVSITNVTGTAQYGSSNFTHGNEAECSCREGLYGADSIPNDSQVTMPVFADPTATSGSYTADTNSWILSYPGVYNAVTNGDFKLQQYSSGTWTTIATLNGSTYGTPYKSSCTNLNYCGFTLDWTKVWNTFGAGTYRFNVSGQVSKSYAYCLASPPFCLQLFSCNAADGTVRFDASYSGGNFGSATSQGNSWSLCCGSSRGDGTIFNPITWADSFRYYGFFGDTKYDKIIDTIKYQTGVIAKIRDEVIKKFTLKLGMGTDKNWAQWMIERFASYGMEADKLLVNDYNINNPQYNFRKYWVVGDGNVAPDYKGSSRYMKVKEIAFKEGQQFIFRDRCCS